MAEPLNLEEVKDYLRIETAEDDPLLNSLIKVARKVAEEYTARGFFEQVWIQTIEREEITKEIAFLRSPFKELVKIETQDSEGNWTIVSGNAYYVKSDAEPAKVKLKTGESWGNAVETLKIEFKTGYSTTSEIPEPLKLAILRLIAYYYENRGDATSFKQIPDDVKILLDPFRVIWL